ncbi:uncharacterized protein LOC142341314 [Convolutriloba macropyga]|uniref:uncharacterized protein LOC142341314 n=1 Tax=Convolutriloba macropyga TaxID=536237 RepID=UPI003F52740E
MTKWRQGRRTTANIKWEALRHKEKAEELRQRTAAIIEDDDIGATRSWNEVSSILVRAAKEVCGEQSKRVENPWIIGAVKELAELRANNNKWIQARNEATNNITHRIFKSKLTNARKTLKKKLKHLEREWWEEKLEGYEAVARARNFVAMYSLLRQLGTRSIKALEGTTITSEKFREHFSRISARRYKIDPGELMQAIDLTPDKRHEVRFRTAAEEMNQEPTTSEVLKAIDEVNDTSPGADKLRIRYIREATAELKLNVTQLVQEMFTTKATHWEQSVKIGQIVALFKKGDRNECGNYRGVCLLSMLNRIIARILGKRLRIWTKKFQVLDQNQNGFRPNRSTADATQVITRIQEDMPFVKKRRSETGGNVKCGDSVGRLHDLEKPYPRVFKPAFWEFLEKHGLKGNFLNCVRDLNETTEYCIMHVYTNAVGPRRGGLENCAPPRPFSSMSFTKWLSDSQKRNPERRWA